MTGDIATGPNSLVGESVVVELVRPGHRLASGIDQEDETTPGLTSKSFSGVLDNVGEFGVVATLEDMGQKFYPWSSILSISSPE